VHVHCALILLAPFVEETSVCNVCADDADYDDSDVAADCVLSPLNVTDSDSAPVFVTAFYSATESRDTVACSNSWASSRRVHVVSLSSVDQRRDDVRRRAPRIRVNVHAPAINVTNSQGCCRVTDCRKQN